MLEPNVSQCKSWVVPLRTSGRRPPLFCACAGGGDAFEYRDFADALPDDQPVYAFGVPTLGEEAQFPTVEQLAAIYVRKVRELQKRGPYQLCGHSFGGLVVYEMAAQLTAEGEENSAPCSDRHPASKIQPESIDLAEGKISPHLFF